VGHCYRHPERPAHDVLLWNPNQGRKSVERPAATSTSTLLRSTEIQNEEELQQMLLLEVRDLLRDISEVLHRGRPSVRVN